MKHCNGSDLNDLLAVGFVARLMAADDGDSRSGKKGGRSGPASGEGEDLPYRVELWNDSKTAVEQVLAVTASASIGHAAFYAAAREFAERYVTLRHKQMIINRWNTPSH